MGNKPIVHIGLPKTATSLLQRDVFPKLSNYTYIAKHPLDRNETIRLAGLTRLPPAKWEAAAFEKLLPAKFLPLKAQKNLLWSEELFSSHQYQPPSVVAKRLRDLLGPYDVLLICRSPVAWLESMYHFRLAHFEPTTFDGINRWIELDLDSHQNNDFLTLNAVETLNIYRDVCGGDVNVVPYELMRSKPEEFARQISEVLKLQQNDYDSFYSAITNTQRNVRLSQARANLIRKTKLILEGKFTEYQNYVAELVDRHGEKLSENASQNLQMLSKLERATEKEKLTVVKTFVRSEFRYFNSGPKAEAKISEINRLRAAKLGAKLHNALKKDYGVKLDAFSLKYTTDLIAGNEEISEIAHEIEKQELVQKIKAIIGRSDGDVNFNDIFKLLQTTGFSSNWASVVQSGELPQSLSKAMGVVDRYPDNCVNLMAKEIVPSAEFAWAKVKQFNGHPPHSARKDKTFTARAVKILRGQNMRIYSPHHAPIIATKDNRIVSDISPLATSYLWDKFRSMNTTSKISGKTLYCGVHGGKLFPHWLLDILPRIGWLNASGQTIDDFDTVLFAHATRGYHNYSLRKLANGKTKFVQLADVGPVIEFEDVTFVTNPRTRGMPNGPKMFDYLQKEWGCLTDADRQRRPTRKIYISRARAKRRVIINENDVRNCLFALGFEEVFAEDLSIQEMAQICNDASHVVGPHGGGFANIAFCQPDTKILEIFSEHISRDYWGIATMLGFGYHIFQALNADLKILSQAELAKKQRKAKNNANMFVEIDKFQRAVRSFLD